MASGMPTDHFFINHTTVQARLNGKHATMYFLKLKILILFIVDHFISFALA